MTPELSAQMPLLASIGAADAAPRRAVHDTM